MDKLKLEIPKKQFKKALKSVAKNMNTNKLIKANISIKGVLVMVGIDEDHCKRNKPGRKFNLELSDPKIVIKSLKAFKIKETNPITK